MPNVHVMRMYFEVQGLRHLSISLANGILLTTSEKDRQLAAHND